ncbi:MAG: hypothetical protein WBP72_01385 [Rhodocyclaceae bacterium]
MSNILAQMQRVLPLTNHALDFLMSENLPGLCRLARGEVSHQEYVSGLDAGHLAKHQAAKVALEAREAERQARVAHYLPRKAVNPSRNVASAMEREAERKLRQRREREAADEVLRTQRVRQAEWKAQRQRNGELAALAYEAFSTKPGHIPPSAHDIARYFHLSHLKAAVCPPISNFLESLFCGRPLTDDEIGFLRKSGPEELYRLAFGQLTLDGYREAARASEAEAIARMARAEAAEAARIARMASEEAEEAARIARESDPEYIAMRQTQALYEKYGVSLIGKAPMMRMTNLLQHIDAGNRLPKEELAWLSTEGKAYFTSRLREAYHRLEADFHAVQHKSTQDPWDAINASGHNRKCHRSETALELLESLSPDRLKHPKVRSAVLTTRGGALRDLSRRSEAIDAGEKAHRLMPKDYRPCTLLGALHMELSEFETGRHWYDEARKRGAPEQSIDSELRRIFQQMDAPGREAMKRFLLAQDPSRYRWVNEKIYGETARPKKRREDG